MRFNGLTAIAIYLLVVASTVAGYWLATKERLAEWKRAVVNWALVAWYGYIVPAAEAVAKAYGDAGDETATPPAPKPPKLSTKQQLALANQRIEALTEIMRAMAMQLNHNTTTMKRWSTEHHELNVIEYRHYKKEKGGQNGASKIISLDEAAGR